MSWTKRQFIEAAFEEIGIGSYQFDIQPEMYMLALKRLDSMMASWNAKGIRLSYPMASTPTSGNLNDDTNIPDNANEAVYLNLAVKISPAFGKQVSQELKHSAFTAYNIMLARNIEIPERQINQSVPAGAGNKWRRNFSPYLIKPEDRLSDEDGLIDFN